MVLSFIRKSPYRCDYIEGSCDLYSMTMSKSIVFLTFALNISGPFELASALESNYALLVTQKPFLFFWSCGDLHL
jgi:hypothetical protein